MNSALPHSREQRFKFIEALALWEGTVKRRQVSDAFGVAPNHVTNDLRIYDESHPNNIRFDPRIRAYVPQRTFKPAYISSDPSEYLSLLYAHADSKSEAALANIGGQQINAEIIPNQPHGLSSRAVQIIIRAIRTNTGLSITYNSMSSSKPSKRNIWPHSFFHTGFRWQVRAYDSLRKEFRDFVIQRMEKIKPYNEKTSEPMDKDTEWSNIILIDLRPNPEFNDHQKMVIANDYGMKLHKGQLSWKVKLRQSLFPYFAVRYNLSKTNSTKLNYKHPVVLHNHNELSKYFFNN